MKPKDDKGGCDPWKDISPSNDKNLQVQLVLSLVIGVSAFLTFCILRPRWPSLYAARKRRLDPNVGLPTLSNSAFGWIPQLYKVTEEQVLASAGLDAFVFLTFFKMSARLFALMAFFATAVLWPINKRFEKWDPPFGGGHGHENTTAWVQDPFTASHHQLSMSGSGLDTFGKKGANDTTYRGYLWAYVVFTYFFVALTIHFLNWETFRIIRYRQNYLGSQSTVTDRTFRLTGIPSDLRSEDKIRELIEKLDIGTVDSVTICRKWEQLDRLVELRDKILRKLEGEWAKFIKSKTNRIQADETRREDGQRNYSGDQSVQNDDGESGENGQLLEDNQTPDDWEEHDRPKLNLRFGFLGLRFRKVDSIDYYEERMRRIDDEIKVFRRKTYVPTDMALVTMDSVASCQMVIQARIDPRPGALLTKPTPAPSDLIWQNTYAPRGIRRLKSWAVTLFITFLTLLWIFPTAFVATLVSFCTLKAQVPQFALWLRAHSILLALFQNGIPTLVVSLLNVAVPYLYEWLSNCQGIISQGDVELSVVSKNFFFIFFNTFFVFTVSKTGADFWSGMQELLKDTSKIPITISQGVDNLSIFYISFVMLQGIGLMPFRILEVGSVALYPFQLFFSKTPRDFAELKKPPPFQYGFFLPTALLVFNLCLIYSVLKWGFAILITGTLYFVLGFFAFKYMLLYAMDQPQHATGGAWRIICYRIIVGLLVFEVVMIGANALQKAFVQSVAIAPLIPFTIWYCYYIKQRFEPLTMYIALRAIRAGQDPEDSAVLDETSEDEESPRPTMRILRRGSTIDEFKEQGMAFVNPSLFVRLEQPWIYKDPAPSLPDNETETDDMDTPILRGADSTLGIGDSNVWRDGGDSNV